MPWHSEIYTLKAHIYLLLIDGVAFTIFVPTREKLTDDRRQVMAKAHVAFGKVS
jgi:hypothetical protein